MVRCGRHLVATLHERALVLSTCARHGGLRRDLVTLVNHQSCEGAKHEQRAALITGLGPDDYQRHVCAELGLDAAVTAVMGTAANMQYLGLVTRVWVDLSVTAIVTAGVSGNAGCAGDPAHYDEVNGKWAKTTVRDADAKPAGTTHGTINTLLFFSSPLSPAALARAVVTMTEAKTSALMELAIGSKYSTRLATGTGTDQYAIAAPQAGAMLRTWTGHHTKAGELIGDAVRAATLEALRWQNGLEASCTRSLLHALGRFGVKEAALKELLAREFARHQGEGAHELLLANWQSVVHEPQVAAAAYALAAVIDRLQFGTIGASSGYEALLNQAALLAVGLAARAELFAEVRSELAQAALSRRDEGSEGAVPEWVARVPEMVAAAMAAGWRLKWRRA